MRRSRFLPVFFTLLTIAFVIALYFRLRSGMRESSSAESKPPAVSAQTTSGTPTPAQLTPQTMTVQPNATAPYRIVELLQPAQMPQQRRGSPPSPKAAPTPKPQPQPSVISRVIAPIVKALTPPPRTTAPNPATQQSSSSQPHGSGSGSQHSPGESNQPKDPNSDTTPPQLMSIEFQPPQVHDGEEATVIVTAVDDLSGIRGVSGTMSSPTGKALQGFATQREGETNRYIGRVAIAKNAEEGAWRVNFLNMSDNASNSVTLSYQQGGVPQSAILRVVSSNSDSTPPVLKNIWADRRAVRGGEKAAVFVEATDDKSGVNLVSAVFQSPTKLARVGAGCERTEGDVWRCELSIPTCVDCGDWQLEQVTLQDKANNLATYRTDNPLVAAVKINITGDACDNTPPVLQAVTLDNRDIDVSRGAQYVTVTVVATDDNCGVAGVSGQYTGPGAGSGGFFPLQASGDPNTFTGRIALDAHAARGTWRINSIQLNDKGHNLRVVYANDPLLANAVFQVR
jgi:hypothetical protein